MCPRLHVCVCTDPAIQRRERASMGRDRKRSTILNARDQGHDDDASKNSVETCSFEIKHEHKVTKLFFLGCGAVCFSLLACGTVDRFVRERVFARKREREKGCVCVCVRACVHVCVCLRVCMCACVW